MWSSAGAGVCGAGAHTLSAARGPAGSGPAAAAKKEAAHHDEDSVARLGPWLTPSRCLNARPRAANATAVMSNGPSPSRSRQVVADLRHAGRVERRDRLADRTDAVQVGLPPLLERRVRDGDGQLGALDIGQSGLARTVSTELALRATRQRRSPGCVGLRSRRAPTRRLPSGRDCRRGPRPSPRPSLPAWSPGPSPRCRPLDPS